MRQSLVAVFACLVLIFAAGAWRMPRPGESRSRSPAVGEAVSSLTAATPALPRVEAGPAESAPRPLPTRHHKLRPRATAPSTKKVPGPPTKGPATLVLSAHVQGPVGDGDFDCGEVTVFVADGADSTAALATPHRPCVFTVQVSEGVFEIWAVAGPLISPVATAVASADSAPVELQLEAGTLLGGVLVGDTAHEVNVVVKSREHGAVLAEAAIAPSDDGRKFALGPLPPGLVEVVVEGDDIRPLHLTARTTSKGLRLVLQPLAHLKGFLGRATDGECLSGTLRVPGHPATPLSLEPLRCAFDEVLPADATEATVLASGQGRLEHARSFVPRDANPPSLCVAPPCEDDDSRFGTLNVVFQWPDGSTRAAASLGYSISESSTSKDGNGEEVGQLSSTGGVAICTDDPRRCPLENLPLGRVVDITASLRGCRETRFARVLSAPQTDVTLPCQPLATRTPGLNSGEVP